MMELVYAESCLKFHRVSFFCLVSLLFSAVCPTLNQLRDYAWGKKCVGFRAAITNTPRFSLPRRSMNKPLKWDVLRVRTWGIAGREARTVRVSRSTFIVTELRENRVSACVGLFAVTDSLVSAAIIERLERVFVGRSFLQTQLCR